jgi:hypothetical protein
MRKDRNMSKFYLVTLNFTSNKNEQIEKNIIGDCAASALFKVIDGLDKKVLNDTRSIIVSYKGEVE